MKTTVYEKIAWHADDAVLQEKIKNLLNELMVWLSENNFLTQEGREVFDLGVDNGFSLHSRMVTTEGQDLLSQKYDEWLSKYLESGRFEPLKQP